MNKLFLNQSCRKRNASFGLGWFGLVCFAIGVATFLPAQAADYAYAPVSGSLTSPFGWRTDPFNGASRFHGGIDIAAPEGTPVYTPDAGTVVFSGDYGGYGNVVVVQHPGSMYTVYGHNSYLMVSYGQKVKAGQMISLVGSTGRSTGPHLHFEVRQGNSYVNPLDYLRYLSQVGHYSLSRPVVTPSSSSNTAKTSINSNNVAMGGVSPKAVNRAKAKRRASGRSVEVIKGDSVERVEF